MAFGDGRILSRPLGIEWCGWRSDTLRLQSSGWQLAVNHEPYRNEYQLLMRNQFLKLYAITNVLEIERVASSLHFDGSNMPIFRVTQVAPQIQVAQMHMELSASRFEEIDATPQYIESRVQNLEDLNIFATKKAEQVLIDKADMTVIEHLEAIKRLQSPKQQEIRQRMMREDRQPQRQIPRLHLVAQLVHYAEAA